MKKLTIDTLDLKEKKILVRVDFNVPLNENLEITDDIRITSALPTIKKIIENGGKTILMSHLGRPKGKPNPKMSLLPAAKRLSELLGKDVLFPGECIGDKVNEAVNSMSAGDVMLLENLRFHEEEEKNDPGFAEKLAAYGDIYINDAFGSAHRAHASTEGVTNFISINAAGYLMEKELDFLGTAIESPERPFTAILGGAKITGKIDVIENLLPKVDVLLIGGGMAYTFFKAQGLEIGKSILEEEKLSLAKEILSKIKSSGKIFHLPVDIASADEFSNESAFSYVDFNAIPKDKMGLDIGPKTIEIFKKEILRSRTVIWNGPMGVFEFDSFAKGTDAIAKALAESTSKGATTIVGGGDSAAAVKKAGLENAVSHVSTGGGASLEFLEGKVLPGVAALNDA